VSSSSGIENLFSLQLTFIIEAQATYDKAVQAGKLASLLVQHTADGNVHFSRSAHSKDHHELTDNYFTVFQTSIGNIPAGKKVEIRLTYVSELNGDVEADQMRFVLPTTIAPRYTSAGAPNIPTSNNFGFNNASPFSIAPTGPKIAIAVSCEMAFPITSVKSPSHLVEVSIGLSADAAASSAGSQSTFDPTKCSVSLLTESHLEKDFVLLVRAQNSDHPRCLAERHSADDATTALMISVAPRFSLNEISRSQLVFLIDRSGSMQGPQIEHAKRGLEVFLRSIPMGDHMFQIVSFGSSHSSLFPTCQDYNESSFNAAQRHVESMSANMGGTEIRAALAGVFEKRLETCPTAVFVLTDGEVNDSEQTIELVRQITQKSAKTPGFVRVFGLGVGNNVSHHLVEGIARAGNGFAQFVLENEEIEVSH